MKLITAISSRGIAGEVVGSAMCLKTETNLCTGERKRLKVNEFKKTSLSSRESPDNSKGSPDKDLLLLFAVAISYLSYHHLKVITWSLID